MKNMDEIPRGVSFLQDALAERLGRPAAIRAPKNDSSQWYLFDPCFSALQRGMGSSSRDYRSGIHIMDNEIRFYNVHCRPSAKLLRTNLLQRPEALLNAAEKTLHLRRHHLLYFRRDQKARKRLAGDGKILLYLLSRSFGKSSRPNWRRIREAWFLICFLS